MSTKTKEIECLVRLDALNGAITEIMEFLISERLLDKDATEKIRRSPLPEKELQISLNELKLKEKIQLLEYTWHVLPRENITITIVTDISKREFAYYS